MKRTRTAGFTLIEMMIVVAILGILTTLVVVTVNPKARPIDVASEFATLVGDASRLAIRDGLVRGDVALAEGSKRRTRIVGSVAGTTVAFRLEVLVEEPGDSTPRWDYVRGLTIPTSITIEDYAMTVGARASVTRSTDWDAFVVSCSPDGSCSATSVFFSAQAGGRLARVSVLPLGTATYVRSDWN